MPSAESEANASPPADVTADAPRRRIPTKRTVEVAEQPDAKRRNLAAYNELCKQFSPLLAGPEGVSAKKRAAGYELYPPKPVRLRRLHALADSKMSAGLGQGAARKVQRELAAAALANDPGSQVHNGAGKPTAPTRREDDNLCVEVSYALTADEFIAFADADVETAFASVAKKKRAEVKVSTLTPAQRIELCAAKDKEIKSWLTKS